MIYIVQAGYNGAASCYLKCFANKADAYENAKFIKSSEKYDYAIVHERKVH